VRLFCPSPHAAIHRVSVAESVFILIFLSLICILIRNCIITVDDGSDQDHDSHIMVWQLPCVNSSNVGGHNYYPDSPRRIPGGGNFPEIVVETAEEADNSLTSSSLDLGPTPGSGIMTADGSESGGDDQDEFDGEAAAEAAEVVGVSIDEGISAWNDQIESMLNNPAARVNVEVTVVSAPSGEMENLLF
jgi:hypothetical protein